MIKWLWRKWLPVAQAVGNFNAQVILTLFYLIFTSPLGIIFRFFADPLRVRRGQVLKRRTNFEKWQHPKQSIEEARKQY